MTGTQTELRQLEPQQLEWDPDRFFVWMAAAAGCFLAGALVWIVFVGPKLLRAASR